MDVLRRRAAEHPERRAVVFLADGERETARLTYGELDRRARAIAAELEPAARVLVAHPSGIEFVTALAGCLYAGAIAVPCDEPTWDGARERLRAIVDDARPALALGREGLVRGLRTVDVAGVPDERADGWRDPGDDPGRTAVLQYTSGSTRTPRGVVVSHANLMANERAIALACGHDERSTFVGWLPLFHDMGLVGNVLQPLYLGALTVLMPPSAFLERPVRWLRAIAVYRAHTSGGPNFGYELCAARTTPEERAGLDLSSWRVAFNGAEAVRHATLERFTAAFAPHGFDPRAWAPCYGLAEATLMVTGTPRGRRPATVAADSGALRSGRVEAAANGGGQVLVSSGRAVEGQEIAIVEVSGGDRCPPGRIGEIWLRGPSVTRGYWRGGEPFGRLPGSEGPWLRTGDLGALVEGELYVVGRVRELIVVRGQNHFPHDVEWTVEAAHPGVRKGCVAAFAVEREDGERLAVACEVREGCDLVVAARAVRVAVARRHGLHVDTLAFVGRGALPRTTSGKLQRRRIGDALAAGSLPVLAVTSGATALRELLRERCGEEVADDSSLAALGLDSLAAVELSHRLEAEHGQRIAPHALLGEETVAGAAGRCETAVGPGDDAAPPPRAAPPAIPLTGTQRALWYEQAIDPESCAYSLVRALRLRGPLDVAALERAWRALLARHDALRTRFAERAGEPVQRFEADGALEVADDVDLDAEANARPFRLGTDRPLRARLARRSATEHVLVLAAHHTIADLWSLVVVVRELAELYAAERDGRPPALPPPPPGYGERVAAEGALLAEREDELAAWWRRELGGAPPLELPGAARPPARAFAGARTPLLIDERSASALAAAARERGATLHAALLAAQAAVLHRCTGQEDLVLGVLDAGRDEARFARSVGAFVTPLPVRLRCTGATAFGELVEQARDAVLRVREHGAALPLDRIAEHVRPPREPGRPTLLRCLLALHREQGPRDPGLRALALGAAGRLAFDGLEAESVPIEQRSSQLDLALHVAELDGALSGHWEFRTDLFEPATIASLGAALTELIAGAARDPAARIASLPLVPARERARLIARGSAPPLEPPDASARTLHGLVRDQAARTPDAIAVAAPGVSISYAALLRASGGIAGRLRDAGVRPGARVGVLAERSPLVPAALLAILETGAAFVPLSPEEPARRLAAIVGGAGLSAIVREPRTDAELAPVGPPVVDLDLRAPPPRDEPPPPDVPQQAPAYVMHTSGSTGAPKGVVVPHAAIVNRIRWMQSAYPIGADDRVLHKTPLTFDVSLWEVFWPLTAGAALVMASDARRDPERLVATMAAERATHVHFVPSMLATVLETADLGSVSTLRRIVASGEALSPALRDRVHERTSAALVNLYGPTEAAIDATAWSCTRGEAGEVPIGTPIAGVRAHVLDDRLEPLPDGASGQLWLGGVCLAHGYLARPGLTADRFRPDPHTRGGERLYATGDRARRRPDGALVFLGRLDDQVKVAGNRVEPGEVAEALRAHPDVSDAAVVQPGGEFGDRLVAYVAGPSPPTPAELTAHLRERLPAPMLPAAYVALDGLPLTRSGKVDRRALPAVPAAGAAGGRPAELRASSVGVAGGRPAESGTSPLAGAAAQPTTPVETRLAALLRDELRAPAIGLDDDFFTAGGDSIRAIRIVARARAAGISVDVPDLLRAGTVRALARLAATRPAPPAPPATAPFALIDPRAAPPGSEDAYPLSMAQRALAFRALHDPRWEAYVTWVDVRAPWREDGMRAALDAAAARHPYLRSRFDLAAAPEPLQVVEPRMRLPLRVHDVPDREAYDRWLAAERRRPFDLARGPLARASVHRLSDDAFRLTLSSFALDGWCVATLIAELLSGDDPPPPRATYADFAALERAALADPAARDFWRDELRDAPVTRIARTTGSGDQLVRRVVIDAPGVAERAAAEGLPLRALLLGAHLAVVRDLAGQSRIVTGLELHGRPATPGGDRVVGVFNNVVPLVVEIPATASWAELARIALAAEARVAPHRRYPLGRMPGAADRFDTLFVYTHFHAYEALKATGVELLDGDAPDQTYVPLTAHFDVHPLTGRLRLLIDHDPAAIDDAQAGEIAGRFERALAAIADDPHRPRDAAAPRRAAPAPEPSGTVPELVARRAAQAPDAVAVATRDGALSYGELDRRARRLAAALAKRGAGVESIVAVDGRRNADLVVGVLGILYAGAAYLPLDPSDPPARRAALLARAGVRLCVSRDGGPDAGLRLSGDGAPDAPDAEVRAPGDAASPARLRAPPPGALAYVMFTSGSTGAPKAVGVPHGALAAYATWAAGAYGMAPRSRVPLATSPAYDLSVTALIAPLVAGATVRLVPDEDGPEGLAGVLASEPCAVVKGTPSYLDAVAGALRVCRAKPQVDCLVFGGERLERRQLDAWTALAPGARALNEYGPTEATVGCCVAEPLPGDRGAIPIGSVIPGMEAWVADDGELVVAGRGLARGYLGDPARTAESFVPGERPGARAYRTGDLARVGPDGRLRFLGRADRQVKLRGFRVELDEVERVLESHPLVERAAVVLAGDDRLEAHAVTAAAPAALIAWLRERLPPHMVPGALTPAADLPLGPGGKVDHARLAALARPPAPYVAPRTGAERTLAAIWADVLGVERVGIDDDYFALGGDSILAIGVVARAQAAGIGLTTRDLFDLPTVRQLAELAEAAASGAAETRELAEGTAAGAAEARDVAEGRPLAAARAAEARQPAPPAPAATLGTRASEGLPLTPLQEGMLVHAAEHPGAYLVKVRCRIAGPLDADAFLAAWQHVVDRHPALRAFFEIAPGGPRARAAADVQLSYDASQEPLPIGSPPLMRLALHPTGGEHEFVWTHHHLLLDGWSQQIVLDEVLAAYAALRDGRDPRLPAPAAPTPPEPDVDADERWWRRSLADLPGPTHVAPRRAARASALATAELDEHTTAALTRAARALGLTTTTVLHGAWALALAQVTGASDVVFGSTVSIRPAGPNVDRLVGMLVNTLPVRARIEPDRPLAGWLTTLQREQAEARAHDRVPLARIAPRLFDTIVVVENFPRRIGRRHVAAGLTIDHLGTTVDEGYPLVAELTPGERLNVAARFDPELVDRAEVEWMLQAFVDVAHDLTGAPGTPLAQLADRLAAHRAEHRAQTDHNRRGTARARLRTARRAAPTEGRR